MKGKIKKKASVPVIHYQSSQNMQSSYNKFPQYFNIDSFIYRALLQRLIAIKYLSIVDRNIKIDACDGFVHVWKNVN